MAPEVLAAIISGVFGILGSVIAVLISRERKKKMGSVRCDSCHQLKKDTAKNIKRYDPYYCASCRKKYRQKQKNRNRNTQPNNNRNNQNNQRPNNQRSGGSSGGNNQSDWAARM